MANIDELIAAHQQKLDKLAEQEAKATRGLLESLAKQPGVEAERDEEGEIRLLRLPPETPEGELHSGQVEGYEPHFDRQGTTRRVLGHISDEDHVGRGPRNTPDRLDEELAEDPHTRFEAGDSVQKHLDALRTAGLVDKREDGTYAVTEAGRVELTN